MSLVFLFLVTNTEIETKETTWHMSSTLTALMCALLYFKYLSDLSETTKYDFKKCLKKWHFETRFGWSPSQRNYTSHLSIQLLQPLLTTRRPLSKLNNPSYQKKSCNTRSWNNVNAGNNEQLAKWTKVVLEFKHTLNAFVCVGNLSVPAWRSDFQITLVVFSIPLCGHIWLKVLHWVLWNCGILVYFKEVFSSMKSTAIEI